MSIWNKILLGCIFVTALVLFFLSARALQAHRYWCESHNKHVEAIAAQETLARELLEGDAEAGKLGLRQAELELYKLLIGRGRVWVNVRPMEVTKDLDPADELKKRERVTIRVQTEAPDSIEAQAVVYVFEDTPAAEGASYLGQLTVLRVGGSQVDLAPAQELSAAEFDRIQKSQQAGRTWRLCEVMPADSHQFLAGLPEEEIRAMFPESTANEYLNDGKILMKDEAEQLGLKGKVLQVDENDNIVRNEQGVPIEVADGKGKYVRQLRDYVALFDELHRLRSKTEARIEIAKNDQQFLDTALADAREQQQSRQTEIQELQKELTETRRQRDAVLAHQAALAAAIAAMENAIGQLMTSNEATLAEIARLQMEAAQMINAKTQAVVQAGRLR